MGKSTFCFKKYNNKGVTAKLNFICFFPKFSHYTVNCVEKEEGFDDIKMTKGDRDNYRNKIIHFSFFIVIMPLP